METQPTSDTAEEQPETSIATLEIPSTPEDNVSKPKPQRPPQAPKLPPPVPVSTISPQSTTSTTVVQVGLNGILQLAGSAMHIPLNSQSTSDKGTLQPPSGPSQAYPHTFPASPAHTPASDIAVSPASTISLKPPTLPNTEDGISDYEVSPITPPPSPGQLSITRVDTKGQLLGAPTYALCPTPVKLDTPTEDNSLSFSLDHLQSRNVNYCPSP